ncbi:hypothetical protein P7K49_001964 [Saguinus oedipus]|uniref:Uncharacterized protein n=1 Tax=Saguinus oedipus TaxID=9490 RepID=A0ABQ9WIM1_SAGOE|nr:hypothetical protein P7K49_001964 [Saguinus oedipus]
MASPFPEARKKGGRPPQGCLGPHVGPLQGLASEHRAEVWAPCMARPPPKCPQGCLVDVPAKRICAHLPGTKPPSSTQPTAHIGSTLSCPFAPLRQTSDHGARGLNVRYLGYCCCGT